MFFLLSMHCLDTVLSKYEVNQPSDNDDDTEVDECETNLPKGTSVKPVTAPRLRTNIPDVSPSKSMQASNYMHIAYVHNYICDGI